MKKFINNSILFSSIVFLGLFILEIGLRKIPNEYNNKKNYILNYGKLVEVLILGSSHTFYGINPIEINHFKAFNFAFPSQTIFLDKELLKKYSEHLKNLKVIIIPISYFSLFSSMDKGKENWRLKNYNLYLDIQTTKKIEYNLEIFNGKLKENIIKFGLYYGRNYSQPIYINSLGFGYRTVDEIVKNNFIISANESIKRHSFNLTSEDIKNDINLNIESLDYIESFAKNNNIKLIYISTPVNKSYYKLINKNQFNYMLNFINKRKDNKKIFYFDFTNNHNFKDIDFWDADHLNRRGAKKLSNTLDSLLLKIIK